MIQTELESIPPQEDVQKPINPAPESKPASLKEDPDYLRIQEELNQAWLKRTGTEPLSSDHQEYMFGNPADPGAITLEQRAERAFREQYADRAAEYAQTEKVRAYDDIRDDPSYRALQEQTTAQTNMDNRVRAAAESSRNWSGSWNRVNARERIHSLNGFAEQYPEKTQAYAARWDAFVGAHPEIAEMNNAQWEVWRGEHPGDSAAISDYRHVARAAAHGKRRQEMARLQPQVHKSEEGIAKVRAELGLAGTEPETKGETPLSRQKERLNYLQLEDVAAEVRTSIPAEIQTADKESLQAMQKELASLPYVPGNDVRQILDYDGENEGVMMVDTAAIVGSVSPAFENWSNEYEDRQGRVVDVAQQLMKGTKESVDNVFHVTDSQKGIQLKKLSGPGGDLFFVVEGTHRVAGAKLARLPELPAQVENMTNLSEVRTTDPALKLQWEERIKRGFIHGTVAETVTPAGQKNFNLEIEAQVLPWMNLPQRDLIEMTKVYLERYPNSLDKLKSFTTDEKIPPEALLDEIAMNFYLADRWAEYKPKEQ